MLWPSRAWSRPMVLWAFGGGAVVARAYPDVLDCPIFRVLKHPLESPFDEHVVAQLSLQRVDKRSAGP